MKKIQTLLSGLAFLVTAAVVTAHAEEAAAETNAGLAKLLDFRVAIALFVVVGICLLVSLVIWRMPRSKAKGEKGSEGQEVSDKDLEALRISYGFWLVVGALLITLLVLVITLSALAPAAPKTTDIGAIIGAVTGVIGTLTAAFFGIQAAGAGRSQALTTLDNTLKNQASLFRAYAHQA
jgi:heme/copper-type cytochrome/quinol oxidase subunit 2